MIKVIKAFFSGLSDKERKILYIASAVLFLALFDRLIYSPISNESKAVDEKIENQKILIKKNLLILEYRDKIMDDEEAHALFYTEEGMTHEELVAVFLREVEGMAKDNNVALTNINPVDVEEKTGYIQYSMIVECSASMSDMLNYIFAIESSKKTMRVATFEISPKKRDTYEVNCILRIIKIIVMANEEGEIEVEIQETQPAVEQEEEPKEKSEETSEQ